MRIVVHHGRAATRLRPFQAVRATADGRCGPAFSRGAGRHRRGQRRLGRRQRGRSARRILVPGTIFVANGGDNGQGASGTGPGSITVYPPGSTGDVRPEAVITKGIDNPGGLTFDASGDLWVANGSGKIVEYSKSELGSATSRWPRPSSSPSMGVAWPLTLPVTCG